MRTTSTVPTSRKRKKGRLRLFTTSALVMSAAMAARPAPAQAQSTPAVRPAGQMTFNIPAGPLDGALRAFEAATGLTVRVTLPADTVSTLQSPGVTGLYTPTAALERLLEGTALTATPGDNGVLTIDVSRLQESVQVTGRLPHVESPKYVTSLSSTPQTIQVIPGTVMAEQGAFTLSDALRNVPGITLQAGEGGGASSTAGDMFNMRGFSAANSLFVDNVRDDGLITRDVFNLEQVEVYLGPTGSDVGRGNAAGYVNMATKAPKAAAAYAGTLSVGSAENRRMTADLNQPLALGEPGSWLSGTAFRINALWQDGGVAGRDYVRNERRSVAPSLAFGLNSPTRVVLQGQFTRQDNLPDYGVPAAAWSSPLAPTTVLAERSVSQSNYYGSPHLDYDQADQTNVTARVEHDISRTWTLRNQTRYNQTERDAVVTSIGSGASFLPDTQEVNVGRQGNRRENSILSNQTTLTGRVATGTINHALTAALEVTSEDYSAPGMAGPGTRAAISIYDPNPFSPVLDFAPVPSGATTDGSTRTVALSAFDVVSIGRVQLNGGLRMENYKTDYRAVTAAGVVTELDASDTILSGKAGLLYQFSPIGNIYVAYGTTVMPPGTGNFALSAQPNNANNPNIEPQVSRNIEVGSKWELFDRRLSATVALFDTRNQNVIFTIDASAVPPLFNQDDEQRVKGATVGLIGQVTDRWNVMANIAWLDGRIRSQNTATNDNRIALQPEWSGSLWTTYTVQAFSLGGGVRFTERVFVNAANTIAVPAYTLVDAVASYAINSHLTLRLNAYNLTDETYIRSISNNGGRYNPGPARSVLFSTQFGF